jgi:hypothetical protein
LKNYCRFLVNSAFSKPDVPWNLPNKELYTNSMLFWYRFGLVYGVLRHFQQYFRYSVVVSFIGEGNWSTRRKSVVNHWQTLSHTVVSRNRYSVQKPVDIHKILINAIKFYVCLQEIWYTKPCVKFYDEISPILINNIPESNKWINIT